VTARPVSRLPFYLAVVYTLLALYGSLYPLVGWHDSGVDPLAFLEAGWPRYVTTFDMVLNVLAYLPLGLLWTVAFAPRLRAAGAFVAAFALCLLLSFGVEWAQNFLPSRVASNLDLAGNATGGLLGALAGLCWGRRWFAGGRLESLRERYFLEGPIGDRGLLLLLLWLLTQLDVQSSLFGTGNLRTLLGLSAAFAFQAGHFIELEMAIVAAQTLAVGLIAGRLARRRPVTLPVLAILAALVVKSGAILVLMEGRHGLVWLTPGALNGLLLGSMLWLMSQHCGAAQRRALAALALMFAAVLANLMPDNPYLDETLRVWRQGHFLNFNGATRLVSSLWPFLALPWLMFSRTPHDRHDS